MLNSSTKATPIVTTPSQHLPQSFFAQPPHSPPQALIPRTHELTVSCTLTLYQFIIIAYQEDLHVYQLGAGPQLYL